jgi:hypothetical protein
VVIIVIGASLVAWSEQKKSVPEIPAKVQVTEK